MSNKDDAAFAGPVIQHGDYEAAEMGLTKREYAAIQIYTALCSDARFRTGTETPYLAHLAVIYTDALFDELGKAESKAELEKEPT